MQVTTFTPMVFTATHTGGGNMYWETLPKWFWVIYYLFLFTTAGTAIFSVLQKKLVGLSVFAILFAVTVPIVGLINSIGREAGVNEWEHFLSQLQKGAIWPVFTIIGYVFLFVWWGLFLLNSKTKKQGIGST
jgi:hypothetical protein